MSYTPTNTSGPKKRKEAASSDSPILDWDRILHKSVRTSDNEPIGKVIALPDDRDTIILMTEGSRGEYEIPKSKVQGFNGAEVILDLPASEASSYKIERTKEVVGSQIDKQSIEKNAEEQKKNIPTGSDGFIAQEEHEDTKKSFSKTKAQETESSSYVSSKKFRGLNKTTADFQCFVCGAIFTTDEDRIQHLDKEEHGLMRAESDSEDREIAQEQEQLNESHYHHI
jgi:hypothetical protein